MRLTDTDALKLYIDKEVEEDKVLDGWAFFFKAYLDNAPAIDIVQCKECKHRPVKDDPNGENYGYQDNKDHLPQGEAGSFRPGLRKVFYGPHVPYGLYPGQGLARRSHSPLRTHRPQPRLHRSALRFRDLRRP